MKEELKEAQEQIVLTEEELSGQEIEALLPEMNQTITETQHDQSDVAAIISDETLVDLYNEVLTDLRKRDEEFTGYLASLVNMVLNEGDATSASKEAMVNMAKIISDIPDKKTKIADLMTRLKLRERDTMPRWLAAKQTKTTVHIGESGVKREILKQIELQQKRTK